MSFLGIYRGVEGWRCGCCKGTGLLVRNLLNHPVVTFSAWPLESGQPSPNFFICSPFRGFDGHDGPCAFCASYLWCAPSLSLHSFSVIFSISTILCGFCIFFSFLFLSHSWFKCYLLLWNSPLVFIHHFTSSSDSSIIATLDSLFYLSILGVWQNSSSRFLSVEHSHISTSTNKYKLCYAVYEILVCELY